MLDLPLDLLNPMPYNTDDDGDVDDGDYDVMKMLSFSFELHFRECFADDLKYPLQMKRLLINNMD